MQGPRGQLCAWHVPCEERATGEPDPDCMQPIFALLSSASVAEFAPRTGPDLTRYLVVCGGLLVAIVVLAWGFRKLLADQLRARASRRSLALVDVLPLGGKRQLGIVRCYDRTFVLGLGEKDVRLIAELDSEVAQSEGKDKPTPVPPREFRGLLESANKKAVTIPRPEPEAPRRPRLKGVVG